MTDLIVPLSLIALLIAQQLHIHSLLNKLMSRNYTEYLQAQASAKPRPQANPEDDEPQEDLRHLGSIQGPIR